MKVQVEALIRRPIGVVATFAGDPSNAPLWYVNIKEAVWKTEPPLRIGSQIAFVAHFLGRKLAYTYEIKAFTPGKHLVMATAQGPFPMRTTYTWDEAGDGTRMTLTNEGEPSGFARLTAGLMTMAMKRAMTKDLKKLKVMLEST
jgi:hypothetical protein